MNFKDIAGPDYTGFIKRTADDLYGISKRLYEDFNRIQGGIIQFSLADVLMIERGAILLSEYSHLLKRGEDMEKLSEVEVTAMLLSQNHILKKKLEFYESTFEKTEEED